MTVRLLAAWGIYPANAIISIDSATETGLVVAKLADTVLTGGVAYVAPVDKTDYDQPAKLRIDPLTGAVTGLVGPGGVLLGVPLVILQSAAPITLTGTTVLTTLAKKTIPAGTLRVGDALVVRWLASNNNNANSKTVSLRLGAQEYFGSAVTTATTSQHEIALFIRGATSQVGGNQYGGPAFGNAYAGSAPVAINRDIAASNALTILGQLAVGTDTMTLEAFSMTLIRGVGVNEA